MSQPNPCDRVQANLLGYHLAPGASSQCEFGAIEIRLGSRNEVALPRSRQTIQVPPVVLNDAGRSSLRLKDQFIRKRGGPKFPSLWQLEDIAEGFELVDRQVRHILVRNHHPGLALGVVKQVGLGPFLEARDGRSRG